MILEIKNNQKIRGLKMMVFQMKYEHQINWANTYDNNLDISISRLAKNGQIYLLSTTTLLVSWHVQIWKCVHRTTLNKNLIEYIYLYSLIPNNTSCLSVSFKPTFDLFDSELCQPCQQQVLLPWSMRYVLTRSNTLNFFRLFGLTKVPLFIFCPLFL